MTAQIVHLRPPPVTDHNSARWLRVVYAPAWKRRREGWYVERTCPCCKGELVTIRLSTEAHARSALFWMVDEASRYEAARAARSGT
jgi:hypothetical protein